MLLFSISFHAFVVSLISHQPSSHLPIILCVTAEMFCSLSPKCTLWYTLNADNFCTFQKRERFTYLCVCMFVIVYYMYSTWQYMLTCPKPIGCCCWGWNAGVIFCGLLRRGVEWWWCRPGMPRPLDWHKDSKTEVGSHVKKDGRRNGEVEMTC